MVPWVELWSCDENPLLQQSARHTFYPWCSVSLTLTEKEVTNSLCFMAETTDVNSLLRVWVSLRRVAVWNHSCMKNVTAVCCSYTHNSCMQLHPCQTQNPDMLFLSFTCITSYQLFDQQFCLYKANCTPSGRKIVYNEFDHNYQIESEAMDKLFVSLWNKDADNGENASQNASRRNAESWNLPRLQFLCTPLQAEVSIGVVNKLRLTTSNQIISDFGILHHKSHGRALYATAHLWPYRYYCAKLYGPTNGQALKCETKVRKRKYENGSTRERKENPPICLTDSRLCV